MRVVLLCSGAAEDERLRDELATYLAPLERKGRITVWHEGLTDAGTLEIEALQVEVGRADVVVALLTADLLADGTRIALIEQLRTRAAPLVPVLVRACGVEHSPFASLALLPRDHRTPVALWPDRGLAWGEVAAAIDPVQGAAAAAELPPNNLPARRLFVGRADDLAALRSRLAEGRIAGITQRASVYGLGGVGKTSLALEYAYRHAEEYPGGLFWVRAEGDPVSALLAFSGELRSIAPRAVAEVLDRLPQNDAKVIAAGVRTALQRNPEPSLLVLDNVDADWSLYVPGGAVRVVLTTRDPELALVNDERAGCRLDVLRREDAVALAEAIAGASSGAEAEVRERVVVRDLDGLAVAVEMAARAVKRWTKTWARYEAELAKQSGAVLGDDRRLFGEHGREHGHGALAAIDLSIARCPAGAARALLESLAALAPERAPIAWVEAGAGLEAEALETAAAWEAVSESGLVKIDAEAGEAALHRLVHRRLCETTAQEKRDARAAAMAEVVLAWLRKTVDIGRIPEVEAHRLHAETILGTVEKLSERLTWLLMANSLAEHHDHRGAYAEAHDLFRRVLQEAENLEPPDEQRVAEQLNSLALLLSKMGDMTGAYSLLERARAIDEITLSLEHPRVAVRLVNLARVGRYLDRHEEACSLLERALLILEKAHGLDHPRVAHCLSTLVWVLNDVGRPSDAKAHAERALAISEDALGVDHPEVAVHLSNLAMVLQLLGKAPHALPLLERAIAIQKRMLGFDHPALVIRVLNITKVMKSLGDVSGARSVLEEVLVATEQQFGSEHPIARRYRNYLAALGPPPDPS